MDVKSTLSDLSKIIGSNAPLIAASLGGNYASVVLDLLAKLFGTDSSITSIINAISSNSDAPGRLRDLENQHCLALQKMANESFKLEVDDRHDARDRQLKMHDWVPSFYALGYLFIYAIFQFYIIHYAPNPSNEIVSARFQDGMMVILAYYFGGIHPRKKKH